MSSKLIYEFITATGHRLQVRHGDLTLENTAAIVNAANERLQHGGGVAGAICRAGGSSIQEESSRIIEEHGNIATGTAVSTTAGSLPCRNVIHAVGPIWHDGKSKEEERLALAVRNSLNVAAALGAESIALPAISSGIFGFPKPFCAQIMTDAALAWATEVGIGKIPIEIRFVNFDDPTVNVFRQEFENRWGPKNEGTA